MVPGTRICIDLFEDHTLWENLTTLRVTDNWMAEGVKSWMSPELHMFCPAVCHSVVQSSPEAAATETSITLSSLVLTLTLSRKVGIQCGWGSTFCLRIQETKHTNSLGISTESLGSDQLLIWCAHWPRDSWWPKQNGKDHMIHIVHTIGTD